MSQDELDEIAAQLNARPRQTLGWMTPAEKLAELTTTPPQDPPAENARG
jgi:IS30 family transposase